MQVCERKVIKDAYKALADADLDRPISDIIEALSRRFCLPPEAIHDALYDH